ncbi:MULTISPECIES: Wzz/FepE/Etk N-terminal domain-containing protein [Staphylococcus]|nr:MULTISPECIES: Wzz/FepE/Etk N-terminal domain-containing protein [Staphylococcus]MBO0387407.1 capsule biosynthesis protein CapA [Staphylococcus simulans]MBU6942457.1 capsule biosynthesis protein CapA [Staphylococcus sp. CWZ226]MDQ7115509.1 Wzz/FepE/Etk N-terminal domain-containing protein [Staphylococcus simulans]MDQ7140824.1 Wzz/FepE/Etk N-terminal domain-containing protein [Staphylococcus simulans]PNZ45379.1 capsule biosynthesis protein CapA [Staphylococcus simulans]
MERKFDLSKLVTILKNNLKLIVGIPLLFLIVSLILTFFFMKPKFESSTQIIVNQSHSDEQFMAQQVQSDLKLVNTYTDIIKSPNVLNEVAKNKKVKYTPEQLSKMVNVQNKTESQILNISVVSQNKNDSKLIANEVAGVFKKNIKKIMNVDNVTIISKADKGSQVYPKPILNSALAILLGVFVALLIVLVKEMMDKRIKSEQDVEEILNLPVLGTINKIK